MSQLINLLISSLSCFICCFALAEDSVEWKYNPKNQYDIYYHNDQKSVYNNIYNNKFIPYDKFLINKLILKCAGTQKEVSILDFGSGNGRHFPIYLEVADKLKKQNKNLILIAYDPSEEAFKQYSNLLKNLEFKNIHHEQLISKYFKINILEKSNFKVILVQPYEVENIAYIKELVENVDITLCLFGVLSHIQKKSDRVNTMRILHEISAYKLFLSFPSYKILEKERLAFEVLRDGKFNIQINNRQFNLEKGDLLYARNFNGMHIENFFHVYENIAEIRQELELAGLDPDYIGINKMLHETTMIKYPSLGYADCFVSNLLSKILPEGLIDSISSYYAVEVNISKK
jgi:hypothetical protein